jgi:hypothetical protein
MDRLIMRKPIELKLLDEAVVGERICGEIALCPLVSLCGPVGSQGSDIENTLSDSGQLTRLSLLF